MSGEGFHYLDILLLAMIAGFVVLRLRSLLGRKTDESKFTNENLQTNNTFTVYPDVNETVNTAEDVVPDKFNEITFLEGAKSAYEQIIGRFNKGNIRSVKNLLNKDVFEQFQSVIDDRKNKNYFVNFTFIGFKTVEILKKNFGDKVSEITVRFVTEFILFIKDDSGKIINGSADSIKQSDDTWIFHKKKNNPNPNWLLVGTATNK
jgi:predicted lipid-binding transport protein (Tim44 family)|tara:strand:+ start:452 stop:1066 length:615 start_codon:yes stop_codon:yes gene_type:complete